ncbi:CPXCG motif-containing cysteine-rich protein [Vibrio hangzhouensis]|uniref:CPXCG motif-containing cysteine-rich protein n=1 Tax=Vibrio hangzhouensis TaxID=462991 RepID=UPI001C981396|nr:CPXCG motif-containing cysteine-rich protein [Vibrio hangzhouensis]MBY6196657.1 CPXCG motif-containing cysteine-rich protein [Vibrio hangzhouensis]
MDAIKAWRVNCPYCGEAFETSIDCSVEHQEYIEDCHVCCRPILFEVTLESDDLYVTVRHENDAY